MGYWKGRHFALEQDFEAFRTEAGAFRTEKTELAKISKDQRLFIQILESEALTLRATSTMLTNSCASLRTANNELAERLRKQVIRLAPVLPPTPEAIFVHCTRMHLSLNEIEAKAALRKENDELRDRCVELKTILRDVQAFVEALDRK
jgi:hypothetical protein